MIMDTLASLALATEPPRAKLMLRAPYDRDSSVVSKPMLRQMLGHSLYQLIVLFILCYDGHNWFGIENGLEPEEDCEDGPVGLEHLTIVFNTFVWMQLFNEINSRRIDSERNVFEDLHKNYYFLAIMVIQIVGQVIITEFGGEAFKLDPDGLRWDRWLVCIAFGLGELVFHQVLLSFVPVESVPDWMVEMFVISIDDDDDDDEPKVSVQASRPVSDEASPRRRSSTIDSIKAIEAGAKAKAKVNAKQADQISIGSHKSTAPGEKGWNALRHYVLKNERSRSDGSRFYSVVQTLRKKVKEAALAEQEGVPQRKGSVGEHVQTLKRDAAGELSADQVTALSKAAPAQAAAECSAAPPVIAKVTKASIV
jgi:hypothetical protein